VKSPQLVVADHSHAAARGSGQESIGQPMQTEHIPQHVPERLVRDFNHVSGPEVQVDAFGVFRNAPKERIFFSPRNGGYWVLTKTEDIREALQHPEMFSSSVTGIPAQPARREKLIPLELDPPEHQSYRRVLAPHFAPKVVKAKAESITATCVELIEPLVSRGACEFIADFAQPFPTTIFTKMLGLPNTESKKFVEWNNVLLHAYGDPQRRAAAGSEINGYLRDLIEQRIADPQSDLLSDLLATQIDGERATRDEVQNFTFMLFVAGLDTVTAALALSFKFLAENPSHRQQIVDNPDVVAPAVEELLRAFSFVNMSRTVVSDTEFRGVEMKAGDRILTATAFASIDEAEFDHPLVVDFDRPGNNHFAFGAGPHRCAGSHLARQEMRTAITEFHLRIPTYSIPEGEPIAMHGGGAMGIDRLPLEWRN
jgi:cytochrome P450